MNNIPTLASRLNGLSIANVAASSHSYDLNSRRWAVRRSPAWPELPRISALRHMLRNLRHHHPRQSRHDHTILENRPRFPK